MSNRLNRHPGYRIVLITLLMIGSALVPTIIDGQVTDSNDAHPDHPHPLLVRAGSDDTPASFARRYYDDASRAWMIEAYNRTAALPQSEAMLIPQSPFRFGGLTPEGYQTVPVLAYTDMDSEMGFTPEASAKAFSDQLRWLKTNDLITISPAQLVAFMTFSDQIPHRAVLITVDTESRTFHDLTVPLLKELGFTATVFVATGRVGDEGSMTWNDLKQIRRAGFTIGCRGRYGRSLTRRKRGQSFADNFKWIESELRQAKVEFETHLDEPCRFLAYPQGGTSSLISAMAAKLGFTAAFTLSPGENPFFVNRFGIHRTVVHSRLDLEGFGDLITTVVGAHLN